MPRKRTSSQPNELTESPTTPEAPAETKPTRKRVPRKAATTDPEIVKAAEQVSEPSPVKTARPRAKSAPPKTEPASPTVEEAAMPTKAPKTTRAAKSKATVAPPVEDAKAAVSDKPSGRRRAEPSRAKKQEAAPKSATPETKPGRSSGRRTTPKPETAIETPSASDEYEGIMLSWRPLTRKEPKTPAPKAASPKQSRRTPEPKAEPKPQTPELVGDGDGELVILEWRSSGRAKTVIVSEGEAGEVKAQFRERRKGRERQPKAVKTDDAATPETAEERAEPKQAPESEPPAKQKVVIPIPVDAPQVVLRDRIPTLVRDGRVYPPLFFFGNPADDRRTETVMNELKMAANSGIHLHTFLIPLEVDPSSTRAIVDKAARLLKAAVEVDPDAQVLFRLVFTAPHAWMDKYPNAKFRGVDGEWANPSICDDQYWSDARICLVEFCSRLNQGELRKHVLGVHLDRGEWFISERTGYDDSKAAQTGFREWARQRYAQDEVTFRASWFDGSVKFDGIQVPKYRPEGEEGERFIRFSRRQRRYVDYFMFLSDATAQRIGELAYAAKEASNGYFLVGTSYGYTFEWSYASSGHLSLGKLLRTPEIDFIAGPPSYRTREPGGAAAFPGPVDSFALNGKLFVSEEDFKTSLSLGHEPDEFNPALGTPQALENVHWRGAGAALAHATGVSWMDMWGNGWLRTPSVWQRAASVKSALIDRMEANLSDPDVAVFVDERALAYLVDPDAFQLLVQNVRESVLRAGVSVGFYLLSDLAHREHFPDSRLYLFLNAWDIRPNLRAAIKSRLQCDGKVLFWLYSAGLFDAGRDSLERAREVTGIALKPQPFHSRSGTTILNKRHPLTEAFPDKTVIGNRQLEPSYFAIPEGATVLGEYTQTGLPSFVVKEFRDGAPNTHWTSVFLGEPAVNPALIRALAQMAGVHIWNFQDDVCHVRLPFCTIHSTGSGMRTVALPPKFSAYNLNTSEWMGDGHSVRMHMPDGTTNVFLVGPREELEHFLNLDPDAVLKMDKLPPRDSNNLVDASNFDVPLMKLDEWMGSEEPDEMAADEWFLRAPQITEDAPEQAVEENVGRRRRRRRTGRDRDEIPNATASVEVEVGDLEMSVVFRKRD
jgi:hypothetical protein